MHDASTTESHRIFMMGSVTHSFYPDFTLPRTTVNRAGTQVRYVANANLPVVGCDITTGFYWTEDFLNQ